MNTLLLCYRETTERGAPGPFTVPGYRIRVLTNEQAMLLPTGWFRIPERDGQWGTVFASLDEAIQWAEFHIPSE